jgi:hypothetical protein
MTLLATSCCGPRHAPVSRRVAVVDATQTKFDPTGTLSVRASFRAEMDRRWERLRRAVISTIDSNDALGLTTYGQPHGSPSAAGGDRVRAFQGWLDQAIRSAVLGYNGQWMAGYIDKTTIIARAHAGKYISGVREPDPSRMVVMLSWTVTELEGIIAAVVQQATRELAQGILAHQRPSQVARAVWYVISRIGKARSKLLVEFAIVKMFNSVTLGIFRAAGVRKVGTIPERLRIVQSAHGKTFKRDAGPPDEARNKAGEWTAGGDVPMDQSSRYARAITQGFDTSTVLYHGTSKTFERFDIGKLKVGAGGINVTSSPALASEYAQLRSFKHGGEGAQVLPVFVRGPLASAEDAKAAGYNAEAMQQRGFTGVSYKNSDGHLLVEVFHPKDVRSIHATFHPNKTGSTHLLDKITKAPSAREYKAIIKREAAVQALGEVDVITAGDNDVCQECEDISNEGPYDIDTAEGLIPAHPNCRCAFVPTGDDRYAEAGDEMFDAFDPSELRDKFGKWTSGAETADAIKQAVPELAHLKVYRSKRDPAHTWLLASTHANKGWSGKEDNPVTIAGHKVATAIAIKVNPETKHIHFSELNSHIKGAGARMVEAVIAKNPGYKFSVTDWSQASQDVITGPSFWDKVKERHAGKFTHDAAFADFNPYHLGPGPGGGQFTTGEGGGGGAEAKGQQTAGARPSSPVLRHWQPSSDIVSHGQNIRQLELRPRGNSTYRWQLRRYEEEGHQMYAGLQNGAELRSAEQSRINTLIGQSYMLEAQRLHERGFDERATRMWTSGERDQGRVGALSVRPTWFGGRDTATSTPRVTTGTTGTTTPTPTTSRPASPYPRPAAPSPTVPTPAGTSRWPRAAFEQAGIAVPRSDYASFARAWDKHINMDPAEFKAQFVDGVNTRAFTVSAYVDDITVNADILDDNGRFLGHLDRQMKFGERDKYAYSSLFNIQDPQDQGRGWGKRILAGNVAVYKSLGLSKVKVSAGLSQGGYAWARFGYLPDQTGWNYLRRSLLTSGRYGNASDQEKQQIIKILNTEDRHAMWALADHKYGHALLAGQGWSGTLDLNNALQMARFNAYTREVYPLRGHPMPIRERRTHVRRAA